MNRPLALLFAVALTAAVGCADTTRFDTDTGPVADASPDGDVFRGAPDAVPIDAMSPWDPDMPDTSTPIDLVARFNASCMRLNARTRTLDMECQLCQLARCGVWLSRTEALAPSCPGQLNCVETECSQAGSSQLDCACVTRCVPDLTCRDAYFLATECFNANCRIQCQ